VTITVVRERKGVRVVVVEGVVNPTRAGLPVLIAGRYLVGPLLGRGGAAEVYRAHDQVLDRAVAVKLFLNGAATTDPRRQHREVTTLAGLSHPGLVTLYNAGEQDGRAFFVMQLVAGRTLADRLRENPLPAAETAQLGIDLADALAYVHAHGVIHRDIKPANVLLDEHHRPHLSDFGIATMADSTQITHTGLMIGTAAYLSPEQVRGHPVGPAADIYALGLVLIECLTGQREYPGQPMEAALARLHRQPHVPQDLPTPMPALLQAMTADDPDQRPTAAEVSTSLREDTPPTTGVTTVLDAPPPPVPLEGPVAPAPAPREGSSVPAPGKNRRRKALLVGVPLLGALLVALAVGLMLALPPRSNTPAPTTPTPGVALPSTPPVPAPLPSTPDAPSTGPSPSPTAEQPTPPTNPAPSPNTPAAPSTGPSPSPTAEQPTPPTNPAPSPNTPAAPSTGPSPSPTAEQPTPPTNPAPIPNTPAATQAPATRIQPSPSPTAEQPSPPLSTVSPTSPPAASTTAPTPPPTSTPTPTPTSRKKTAPPGRFPN